jgi:hypothetical protein
MKASVVKHDVEQRAVHFEPAVVVDEAHFRNVFMKWLIRERVVPTISGGVREPEAHFDGLPATEGLMRVLNGRYHVVEKRDAGLASRD